MISRIKTDPRGYMHSFYIRIICNVIQFFSTIQNRMKMLLVGVQYGRNVKFRGDTMFLRTPGTIIKIGNNCTFNSCSLFNHRGLNHKCILETGSNGCISIGDNCGFSGVSIVSSIKVDIGNNVMCGANVIIGDRNDHEDKYPEFKPAPVIIKENVWIGMNCVIMKGVKIGENSIIGANSIVTKDIPANCIAAGNPCRIIKERI